MATIEITPDKLTIRLTRFEKIFGALHDLQVPLADVHTAEAVPNGLAALQGMRAPGLGLPGVRMIGTWRGKGSKTFVSVRRGQPALVLNLGRHKFDRAVVSADDVSPYLDQLRALGVS